MKVTWMLPKTCPWSSPMPFGRTAEQAKQGSRPKEPDAEGPGSRRRMSHRGPPTPLYQQISPVALLLVAMYSRKRLW